jgi:hypothetical protein
VSTILSPEVDFRLVQAIVGHFPPSQVFHAQTYLPFSLEFTVKYQALHKRVIERIGIQKGKPLIVMHWRRGREMQVRCTGLAGEEERDTSINCARNVSDFIALVYHLTGTSQSTAINQTKSFIYIATDEESQENLFALANAGFRTFTDVLRALELPSMSSLDKFVLELMLMCYSDWFFGWGKTLTAKLIVEKCSVGDQNRIINAV